MRLIFGFISLAWAAPGVSQDLPISLAGDGLDLVIEAEGRAQVAPQGYRLFAWLGDVQSDDGSPPVGDVPLRDRLEEMSAPSRDACLPVDQTYHLIGNGPLPSDLDAYEMAYAQSGDEGTLYEPLPEDFLPITIDLADQAALAAAIALVEARNYPYEVQPIVFDCDAAASEAEMAAIRQTEMKARQFADAMGLRVAGVSRIDLAPTRERQENLLASLVNAATASPLELRAQVTVTYRLTR